VTIDAIGCQKEIASTIIGRSADYVLALKGNQGGLFEDVQWLFQQAQASGFEGVAHSFAQSIDKGHGRIEIRRCWTLWDLNYLTQRSLWLGLQTVVMVRELCGRKLPSANVAYKVSGAVTIKPQQKIDFSLVVYPVKQLCLSMPSERTHWSIENSLHWVLDVSFHEDACRIRRDSAPHNMALLRHLALNILAKDSSSKRGIAARRKKAAWDHTYLIKLLTQ
jgi:predicted transposase YbfD/YdcC